MTKKVVIARSNGVDPDSRVEKEANSLAKAGYKVTIIAWDRTDTYKIKEDEKELSETKVKRVSFGAKAEFGSGLKSLIPYLSFQRRLFFWLIKNSNKYDIAHLCDFDTAFVGRKAARLFHKKVVFDIFDYLSTNADTVLKKVLKHAENHIINDADATIICTEERKKQIRGAKPKSIVVIHNTPYVSKMLFKEDSGEKNERIRICYVGILQDYRLIKELIYVIETMTQVESHIGGFGKYEDYVKAEAREHNNIIYYGKVPYAETLALESRCDIMTAIYDPKLGNHYYAAPNKFYEALMLGKPLIMAKGTGMSEIVDQEKIGVTIDYSIDGLKAGIKKLIEKKAEWDKMGKRMRELYLKDFSWTEMEKRLVDLYNAL